MEREELTALVARRDLRTALDGLYQAYQRDVSRFVRVRLGRRAEVADVCQEVWAAVARGLPAFRAEAPPRGWILGIARNKTMDVWRRDDGLETLDTHLSGAGPLAAQLGIRAPTTPTRALSRRRRGAAVRAALATLSGEDRELLELRYVHELKPAEIAEVLEGEVSANTVAQRVVRATRRLRAALSGAGLSKG